MPEELKAFLDAHNDPNASQGAWQAMLEDAVNMYNEQHGTNYDSFDTFMDYVQQRGQQGEVS